MKHTKEPWKVDTLIGCDHVDIRDADGRRIAVVAGTYPTATKTEDANARRIVACVNACKGLTNEQLADDNFAGLVASNARIAELEAALDKIVKLAEYLSKPGLAALDMADIARDALAKETTWT